MHFFQEVVNLISLLKFVIKETNEDLISTSGTLGGTEKGRDRAEQCIMRHRMCYQRTRFEGEREGNYIKLVQLSPKLSH